MTRYLAIRRYISSSLHPFKVGHMVQCLGWLLHTVVLKFALKFLSLLVVLANGVIDGHQSIIKLLIFVSNALVPLHGEVTHDVLLC